MKLNLKYLAFSSIVLGSIYLLWMGMEIIFDGRIQMSIADSIMSCILLVSIDLNYLMIKDRENK